MGKRGRKSKQFVSLEGSTINGWTVIEDEITEDWKHATIQAKNEEGEIRTILRTNWERALRIINGQANKASQRKQVKWTFCGDYVIGRTTNDGLIFYVDYEDYLKIKDLPLCSHRCKGARPYVCYRTFNAQAIGQDNMALLRVLELPYWTRFINGNHCDFRRRNINTKPDNNGCNIMNRVTGIYYNKSRNAWMARVRAFNPEKIITLKVSKDLGECIKARLEYEKNNFTNTPVPAWKQELYNAWGL